MDAVGSGPVGLDSSPVIYYVEEHPGYVARLDPLFERATAGELELVTSELTLLEVLVVPYRAGDLAMAERYEALLTRGRGLRLVEIGRAEMRTAARLRAKHGVRTPDALQMAAALAARCSAFVTNDRRIPALPGLPVVQLSEVS
jgi:predicted nucleic acid-binding protein